MAKPKPSRAKKYTLSLSECEVRRLTAYASASGVSRPTALARLMRQSLREAAAGISQPEECAVNQLGLFDGVQIDIFNQQTKVKNQHS